MRGVWCIAATVTLGLSCAGGVPPPADAVGEGEPRDRDHASLPGGSEPAEPGFEHASRDPATGVISWWLPSGVRVHFKPLSEAEKRFELVVSFAGGVSEERASNRGITGAAMLAWSGALSSPAFAPLRQTSGVRAEPFSADDMLGLRARGPVSALGIVGRSFGTLLDNATLTVDADGFERWRRRAAEALEARRRSPAAAAERVAAEVIAASVIGEPSGLLAPDAEDLAAISASSAEAWLRRIVATAPVEVCVVGDLHDGEARALVEAAVGGLAPRRRIGPDARSGREEIATPAEPIRERRVGSAEGGAAARVGVFVASAASEEGDRRRMLIAAELLDARLDEAFERTGTRSGCRFLPSPAYPGLARLECTALPQGDDAAGAAETIRRVLQRFAADGPTSAELESATSRAAARATSALRDARYWTLWLADLTYRGGTRVEAVDAPAAYRSITVESLGETFRRLLRGGTTYEILLDRPTEAESVTMPGSPPRTP